MNSFIKCIDADIYINDDGTMDCPWLEPYYGDMTREEYEAAGTALSVRRGCHYCYRMLEWKTRVKEEGWTRERIVAHAQHPEWPGEWVCVAEILNASGELVGYEAQWELYRTLHEVQEAGWELIFSYFSGGKDILKQEEEGRCKLMAGCGPKEAVGWCSINYNGTCCLDTASFEEMDRLAGKCGFIRVNDRYLMLKYGVEAKDYQCKNCYYYEGDVNGNCTCDMEHGLVGSASYNGAHACERFIKKGSEVMVKTYYTKCGRKFEKSSTAAVTGYTVNLEAGFHSPNPGKDEIKDPECRTCPFIIEIRDGYPESVFKRFECRAGSLPPSNKNEWSGDLDGKNSIQVKSLEHNFLERVLQYCKEQPDLNASYNQDLEDCRRILSISCSQNKKGVAAKKALIEKFFNKVDVATQLSDVSNTESDTGSSENYIPLANEYPEDVEERDITDCTEKEPCKYFKGIRRGKTVKYYRECEALTEDLSKEFLGYDNKSDAENCSAVCRGEKDKNMCRFYTARKKLEDKTCKECALFGEYNGRNYICNHIYKSGKTGITIPTVAACEHFQERASGEAKDMPEAWDTGKLDKEGNDIILPPAENTPGEGKQTHENCRHFVECEDSVNFGMCTAGNGHTDSNKVIRYRPGCQNFQEKDKPEMCKSCDNEYEGGCIPPASTDNCVAFVEVKKPRNLVDGVCEQMREDCTCFCKHNDGCSVKLIKGNSLSDFIEDLESKGGVDCDIYRDTRDKVYSKKGIVIDLPTYYKAMELINKESEQLELSVINLDSSLQYIRNKCKDIVGNYVEIGFTLINIKDDKLFKDKGYDNLIECVESELNMKKSTAYNLIKIAEKFGDPDTKRLKNEYSQYNYVQCLEMSTMTKNELSQVNPDMSKRDMQELKKSNRMENHNESSKQIITSGKGLAQLIEDTGSNVIDVTEYKIVGNNSKDGQEQPGSVHTDEETAAHGQGEASPSFHRKAAISNEDKEPEETLQDIIEENGISEVTEQPKVAGEYDSMVDKLLIENNEFKSRIDILQRDKDTFRELVSQIDSKFDKLTKKQIRNALWDFINTGTIIFYEE